MIWLLICGYCDALLCEALLSFRIGSYLLASVYVGLFFASPFTIPVSSHKHGVYVQILKLLHFED